MGLRKLSEGSILHYGREVRTEKAKQALRRDIGLVFQHSDDQLFSPTVLEDVAFGPLNLGLSAGEAKEKSHAILRKFGAESLSGAHTHTLSGGQKRIISLAAALVMEPKALLLDEPTNDLDSESRDRVVDILRSRSIAFITVSHDSRLLEDIADRLVLMENGVLQNTMLKVGCCN